MSTIQDFINDQKFNTDSEQAARLAWAIKQAIIECKETDDNENAFSVDAQYEQGEFSAQVNFTENSNMTIMYYEDTDNSTVKSLYDLQNDQELCRLAGLMLSENWVEGWNE